MQTNYLWTEEKDGLTIIGVSEVLQEEVGEISYANLARLGEIKEGATLLNVEASKATIEVASPISGQIVERHDQVEDEPSLLDAKDHDKNWLVKVQA